MAETTTGTLNSLLRGELSAYETYQQALAKLEETKGAPELRRIREEHFYAANMLRQHVQEHGGQADEGSGAWGTFAKAVEGTATLFGADATLKALKEGEEYGIRKYEKTLEEKGIPAECQTLIAADLLPLTRAHVPMLNRLMAGLVERSTPQQAKEHLNAEPPAMLVSAYDSPEKFQEYHLEGAISLDAFQAQADTIPKDREIIFYCA